MFDQPEFLKAFYGLLVTCVAGVTGAGYRKLKKIDEDIDNRPTHVEVEDKIHSKFELISAKQDFTIDKLDALRSDVSRLEDIMLLRGSHDKTRTQ